MQFTSSSSSSLLKTPPVDFMVKEPEALELLFKRKGALILPVPKKKKQI